MFLRSNTARNDGNYDEVPNGGNARLNLSGNVTNSAVNLGSTAGYFTVVYNHANFAQATGCTTSPITFTTQQYIANGGTINVTVTCTVPDTTGPQFVSAATNSAGTTIDITYDEDIDYYSNGADFTLREGGVTRTLSYNTHNSTVLTLNVSPALSQGTTLTLDFTDTGAMLDFSGNSGVNFSNKPVTNNVISANPTVTDAKISISGASGSGGAFRAGDTVTVIWNNTGSGDNNSGITDVTVDFSQFGGGAAVVATNSSNTWTATYVIPTGALDATNRNVSVTATKASGSTTTADTSNATLDNQTPTVSDGNISISGASGSGGAFKIGDTVTASWNNTAGGDNNADTISSVTMNFSAFGGGASVTATNSSGTWTATYTIVAGAIDAINRNASVTATDNAGNSTTVADSSNATVDNIAPTVTGSVPDGGAQSTDPSVDFTVNYSESVSNVSIDDFALGSTGGATGTINNVSANSGSSILIQLTGIAGNGTLKLNHLGSTNVIDDAGNAVVAYTSGTTHTVAIPTAPDAPTIGAATAGDGQVSVAFTAPGNNGGSAITGYTVTSNPGGITAGGNGFTTSPITVTGLTNGTAYTFTVVATNAIGTSVTSAASNSATPKANQTITFANPGSQTFGTTPTLSATSDSGLTVTFTSSTTGVCTITSGGALTFVTAGSCTIDAEQAGNGSFNAAPTVPQTFTVNAIVPGAPTIGTATAGDTQASVAFSAPASNGGANISGYNVTSNPGGLTGTGAGSPITVTGLTNGVAYTFSVTATNSAGTGSASAASNAITPASPQTITFNNPGAQNFGTAPTLTATSDSGLTVTFTSSTTGVCTITSGGALTFITAGTCTINADQAGDSSYLAAPQVSRSFTVTAVVAGAPTAATATAGDTQASIAFTAPVNTGGAMISGYTVTANPGGLTGTGATSPIIVTGLTNGQAYMFTVTADNSAGTGPASAASNSITPKAAQTITFNNPGAQNFGTTPTLTATSNSGLTVAFTSSTTGVCTSTSGGALTFVTAGTCTINADQAGNGSYLAATQVSRSFTVNAVVAGAPVIGIATVTGATSASLTFTAPASNGGAVITGYTVNSTPASTPVNIAASPATISGLTTGQSYTFTVTATNAAGISSASAASNAVVPASLNVAPVISGSPATTATANVAYAFTPTASDADTGTTLTFSASNVPAWASFSSSTGTLSGTPAETDVGSSGSIVISVSDGEASASLPAFSITVQTGNKAPVIGGTPATSVKAGTAYSFTPSASDADANDTLSFSINNKPGWASFSTSNGSLSGTPAQTDAGTTSGIVISVSDGKVSTTLPAFNLQVIANTAPVATPGSSTLNEDEPASIDLGGTDADGDVLTVQVQSQPQHGTLTQSGNAWLYTPQQDYHGADSLSFIVKDATQSSAPATYNLTVTPANDAPVAVDDVLSLARSNNDQYVLSVLGNDKDVDGDTLQLAGASAAVGIVTVSGTSLNYTAPAQYTGPVTLQYSVSDGKKGLATAAVSLTITGAASDLLPVITVPADIEVNATALFTRVQLGTATAVDRNGRRLRVSMVNGSLFFAPGVHQVYWQATDAEGNTATKTQQVRVNPLVSLSKNQVVSEGSAVRVEMLLNGPAVRYPVQVPYTVSGSAGSNDHTLSSGTIEISSGLSTSLEFDVLDDAVSDNGENIIITLGSVNAGSQRSTTVQITENNVAPVLSLNSSQQGENRLTVSQNGGLVALNAVATDANANDVLTLSWQSTLPLSGVDANSRSVDPSALTPGVYPISVTATDNGSPAKSATAQLFLVVQQSLPALTSTDTDGDLIPDNLEGFADEDRDGLPDYKDSISECNVVPEADTEQQAFLAEGEPGACLRRGQQSILASSGGLELGNTEIETDTAAQNIGGIFDFIAYDLPQAGQSYQLILPQRSPVPANAVYRKYNDREGWVAFVSDSKNNVRSALGEKGFCPPPGDAAYTAGLSANHWCVQVTVEDGGPNDADGLVNAAIVDPGGVAVPVSSNKLPQAKPDTTTTRMNQAVMVKVLANDTDADNDALTVSQAVANFGVVKIEADSSLTYTPAKDYVGTDVVVYSVSDGKGGTSSSELTVTVRLNNQPIAGADTAATDDRTAISINVLGNDTDADSDPLKVVSASALTGTVTIETDNRLRYTPKSGFSGTDTISYRISDGFGGEASGQVSVTVTAYQTVTVSNKSSGGATSALWLTVLMLLGLGRRYGVLLLLPLAGLAQAGDWQLQLGAGQSKVSQSGSALQQALPAGAVRSIDDSDRAFSLSLQYQWFERLDAEVGYLDLGEGEADIAADTLTPVQYHQAVQQLTPVLGDGVFAGLRIGLWQQYGWRLQLPLGMHSWKSDLSSTMNGSTLNSETDGTDLYYGLALQYLHDAHWAAGVSWQQIALEPEDVQVLQFTISYRF
ncbi:Ig-like domain-containing protein [Rheinheimera sp.]|uniref:Ig-like domain-containing protein n=1 Tax=Rheinheimera sp. TaxID=1869214 RepID=UPI003D26EAAD